MAESLEEATRNHFIDIYNRRIAIDGIKSQLIKKDCCYIDIGCSSGYMLESVMSAFAHVNIFGADYFSTGLMQCHRRLPNIPLFQIDIIKCNLEDNLFDAISCLNVLEHIEDDYLAIKQLYRIIKPGGVVVLTVPTMPNLYDMYDEVHYHIRRYKLNDLEQKVCSAGFKILKSNYFGVFMYPIFYLIKKINKIKFDKLNFDEKKQKVFNEIRNTERYHFFKDICFLEQALGKKISYPFGFRGYIVAAK
jgi:SAM-dependent methyltransferase